MTFLNLNSWARLSFLGDEGKEVYKYMGQCEAGCNCEQNASNWMRYHEPRWDDGATPASCLCISLAHTQGTVLTETWAAADTGDSSAARFLWPSNTMCHHSLGLCWHLRLLGFPTDTFICLWEFATLGQASWAQKSDTSAPIWKKQAACGFRTKYEVPGAKSRFFSSEDEILRIWQLQRYAPYLCKRFLPIPGTKPYRILFMRNSSYVPVIPTLFLNGFRYQTSRLP